MPKETHLRLASADDIVILIEMNQQLLIDEGKHNQMSFDELKIRMMAWLKGKREAVIVERKGAVIGYMLYGRVADEYFPYKDSIYIRQFFIQPSYRRRGIGQVVFEQIVTNFFEPGVALTLDILESNPEGKAFWGKQGFVEYHTTMRRE